MKKKNVMMIAMMFSVFTTATALTAGAQEIQAGTEETRAAQEMQSGSGEAEKAGTYVLPVKELTKKSVDENPYMAKGDTNIHHDCYNTDTTDAVLPLGIYPEINVSYEKVNANASPAIFLTHADMRWCRCRADLRFVTLTLMRRRRLDISHRHSMTAGAI